MTPNEKAKELINKFKPHQSDDYPNSDENHHAKQCALICVDEVYKNIDEDMDYQFVEADKGYWNLVKQEIKKL